MTDIATRNARNRRAGARWQSEFRDGAREAGIDVERLVQTGAQDEGDAVIRAPRIHVPAFLVVENKTGALNPAFVVEAHREAAHFAEHRNLDPVTVDGIAVVKRRGHGWRHAIVMTTVEHYFGIAS